MLNIWYLRKNLLTTIGLGEMKSWFRTANLHTMSFLFPRAKNFLFSPDIRDWKLAPRPNLAMPILAYVLSVDAFALQWQSWVAVMEYNMQILKMYYLSL